MLTNFLNAWRSLNWRDITWWQWPLVLSFAVFYCGSCAIGFHEPEHFHGGIRCGNCKRKLNGRLHS